MTLNEIELGVQNNQLTNDKVYTEMLHHVNSVEYLKVRNSTMAIMGGGEVLITAGGRQCIISGDTFETILIALTSISRSEK